MTINEAIKVLYLLQVAYPTFYKSTSVDDARDMAQVWAMMFSHCPAEKVLAAVKVYILQNHEFPPAIGQINDLVHRDESKEKSPAEAWACVRSLMSRGLSLSKSEYESLDESIKQAIGSYGTFRTWCMTDITQVENYIANHFQKEYKAIVEENAKRNLIPDTLSNALSVGDQDTLLLES